MGYIKMHNIYANNRETTGFEGVFLIQADYRECKEQATKREPSQMFWNRGIIATSFSLIFVVFVAWFFLSAYCTNYFVCDFVDICQF